MIKVIDNAFSIDVADFLNKNILEGPMFVHGSLGVDFNNLFFATDFNLNDALTKLICKKIISYSPVKKVKVLRCYANIHFKNQPGNWHQDDGDLTFLWMISPTLQPGDGCFEIKDGEIINFVKNRLIIFDAKVLHRGNHSVETIPRITFAIKTQIIE